VAKQVRGDLVEVVPMPVFDYSPLDAAVAEQAQASAERIRAKVKRTLDDVIEIGNDLLAVKEALPHGRFLPWLRAEFGWGERMAQNFISVAGQFGSRPAIIADLAIAPTAAYLLAAPSAPEAARVKAIERAESGEKITTVVAKEILAQARKKEPRKAKRQAAGVLVPKLLVTLQRYQERWSTKELAELAKHLREFADKLDDRQAGAKKPRKGSSE
jgi:hypothetical protein